MLPGPILRAELVTAARRRRYFALRVVYGLLILFVLWVTYTNTVAFRGPIQSRSISIQEVATAAAAFFISFSWVQLLGLLAVAPAMAVGTIATERERRTIEYLFATDLSNFEIVVGKTFARLLLVGKLVLAGLPILFLFRLLGGIPTYMLAASFLISASTALIVTAISVCISVWSRRSRDATVRVYLVLAALLFLPLIFRAMGWMLSGSAVWRNLVEPVVYFLSSLNPIWTLGEAITISSAVGSGLDLGPVWRMLAWHTAISLGLILWATAAVRRVHLRESTRGDAKSQGAVARIRKRAGSLTARRRRMGDHPMIWKEISAGSAKTFLGWAGSAALGLIVITIVGFIGLGFIDQLDEPLARRGRQYLQYMGPLTGFMSAGAILLAAARASGLVTMEKERDTWASLVATPLSGSEIIRGKTLGNLYASRIALAILAGGWLLGGVFDAALVVAAFFTVATFIVCIWFASSLGLFYSLRSKTTMRSMGLTIGTLVFLGGGYLFCCVPVVASGGGDEAMLIGLAPCIPFLMVFPGVFIFENNVSDEFVAFTFAYMFGVFGYLLAGVLLCVNMASEFDDLVGRTRSRPDDVRRLHNRAVPPSGTPA